MKKVLYCKDIQLIVYDFDGVMTDNRVLVQEDGKESVWVSRADGLGVGIIKAKGIKQLILSTEKNKVVAARAKKLKLELIQGVRDKKTVLEQYCQKRRYNREHILYVGNDINDIEVMKYVGIPVAPADAHPSILKCSVCILETRGGFGIVRELADRLV